MAKTKRTLREVVARTEKANPEYMAVLWQRSPALPLEAAFLVAAVGAVVYLMTSRRGPDRAVAQA